MKRYGFVLYPSDGARAFLIAGTNWENGEIPTFSSYEEVKAGNRCPPCAFYTTAESRNGEMDVIVKRFPGIMLCPIEITTGHQTRVPKEIDKFVISDKGKLPA